MENFSQNSKNSEPKEVPLSSASLYYLNNIQSSQEDLRRKSQLSTNNNENFSLAVQNIDNIHPLHNQQLVFNEFPSVSNNLFADQSRVENSFFDRDGISLDLSPPNRQSFKNSNNFQNSPYGHNIYNPVVANNYNYPNSTLKLDSTNPFSPISCKYEYTFDNNSKAFLDESFKLFNHSSPASSRIFDSTDNFLRPVLTKENILGSACDRTFQQSSLFKSPTGFSSNDFESGNRSVFQEMRDSQKMKWVTNQNGNAELLKTSWSCADVPSFNKPDLTMISRVKSRPQACATITSIPEEEEEGKIDETLIVKLCPNLEKMSSQTSISLDLSYKSKIVLKTPTKLIQNYYEVQQSINWDKEVQNMILTQNPSMVMEENFDYIEFKLRQSKVLPDHITVGRQNVVIDPIADADEDEDTIMESMDELDQSWVNPKISATSTPKSCRGSQRSRTPELLNIPEERSNGEKEMSLTCFPILPDSNNSVSEDVAWKPSEPPDSQLNNLLAGVDFDILMLNWCSEKDVMVLDKRKTDIMERIEKVLLNLLKDLKSGKTPMIELQGERTWGNCTMKNEMLTQRSSTKVKKISFFAKSSERKFAVIIQILVVIHKLLGSNSTSTKRELYYNDPEFFQNQDTVDRAISDISCLLNANPWEFAIIPSSKGLVAGDLKVVTADSNIVDFATSGAVPSDVTGIKSFESAAKFILVVEKDTVFQRLLNLKVFLRINKKIILITAKGYPDVNTRLFLKRLVEALRIPVYALVDADPHGIEIMFTYRFGSLNMSHISDSLAVPSVRWIGILPTEIICLDVPSIPLTAKDRKKIAELLKRPYMTSSFKNELKALLDGGVKSEIEGVSSFSINYLIDEYILSKIQRSI